MIELRLELESLEFIDDESFIEGYSTSHNFNDLNELCGFLLAEDLPLYDCVWLIANGDEKDGEIIITENLVMNVEFLNPIIDSVVYIQQYTSYEDAYAVALDMREISPKCYGPTLETG